ncbi:MAG: sugar phosphate isomerase/epimerase [Methanomicrobiaceae archaeon]|nr:sugar phosphate isomerase/epimerase [Methanomicrobiaceae archaeon]
MFGVSTCCLHHKPLPAALDALGTVTDTVEVVDEGLHFLDGPDILETFSFRYFIHAPARSVNIASQLGPIRRASVEVIAQCFEVAAEVDAGVVVHPGYCAWQEERDAAIDQFRRSLGELKAAAEELSVTFFIENMPNWGHFFLRTPDELTLIDGVGLALDVGHAHTNGCLEHWLDCSVAHFHLHDNNGDADSHNTVGDGTIDFAPVMEAVRRNHAVAIIEVATFEGAGESIDALRRL